MCATDAMTQYSSAPTHIRAKVLDINEPRQSLRPTQDQCLMSSPIVVTLSASPNPHCRYIPLISSTLQDPLDLEPALEVMDVPSAKGEEDDGLSDSPPFYAGVLGMSAGPNLVK